VKHLKDLVEGRGKILERKSSKFGQVGVVDRGNELELRQPIVDVRTGTPTSPIYYNNLSRKEIYVTALDKFVHDQLAKPIINLIAFATFNEPPDFQGDKAQVDLAKKIVRDSQVNWMTWGADLEVHGDIFIRNFIGRNPKIASIPPQSIDVDYDEKNIIDIKGYVQNFNKSDKVVISPDRMTHGRIHNTSNMVYGSSTLRPIFWWLDVLDNLWERNWIRAAQYYGAPIVAITGIPGEYQTIMKTALQGEGQRPGKNWIFPEGVKAETLDFTKNYPIEVLVDRVYQYILSSCNIPQHLVYESDSSRGVAMFSGDAFEMMIKMRRQTWSIALLDAMKKIFSTMKIGAKEFNLKVAWAPVFTRDLKSLAALISVGMEHKILSKKTARERLMVDHSDELENIKKQKVEEPDDKPLVPGQVDNRPKA